MTKTFKHSGVEWLGEIPSHWEILPLRAIFQARNEDNKDLKFTQILSLIKDVGVIPYEEKGAIGNKSKDDLSGYKIAKKNDFILNKMNAVIGSLGVSNYDGLVSPIYLVLYISNSQALLNFYAYVFQSKLLQKSLKQVAYGIMEIRESIDFLEFKNFKFPLPPLDEQRKIAEFLDEKCGKIAEFIAKKQALIALLKERKKALINEAVCGRLNLDASATPCEFKRSGVEWLGEIPHHWEVVSLNKIGESFIGLAYTLENVSADLEGIPVLRSNNIKDGKMNYENLVYVKNISIPKRCLTRKNDLLICANNGSANLVGKTALVDKENLSFGAFMMIYRSEYNKFIYYVLQTDFLRNSIYGFSSSTGINQITKNDISTFKIPLPPKNEQQKIAEFLDKKCAELDRACALIQAQIEAMREYKSSLIDSAVRGKFEFERTKNEV